MRWFLNLSTRAKLLLGFGLMLAFLAAVMVTAYSAIKTVENSQRELDTSFANVSDLATLESNLNSNRVAVLNMLIAADKSGRAAWVQDIRARTGESDDAMRRLIDRNRSQAAYADLLAKYEAQRTAFRQAREQTISLIDNDRLDEAQQAAMGDQSQRYVNLRSIAGDLSAMAERDVRVAVARSAQVISQTTLLFIVIAVVALVIGGVMAVMLSRSIANPLKDICGAAERIAVGDLTSELPRDDRGDEVGALSKAFRRMTQSLHGTAAVAERIAQGDLRVEFKPQSERDRVGNALAGMIANLRTITRDIAEGTSVLAASATQIVASSTQLATGSAQTATAVGETTTTVEEVRQTAQVATQKAKYVSESAQNVSSIAQAGRKNTEETGEGMNRIREQMDSIAQSMVRLSEQTQAIGQIITTVDDLAQQSNLLAVNASIEAAKAGEQAGALPW